MRNDRWNYDVRVGEAMRAATCLLATKEDARTLAEADARTLAAELAAEETYDYEIEV